MDPLDSDRRRVDREYAAAHGAEVIDYDRLTLGGSRDFYVSFDIVGRHGARPGPGRCVAAWKAKNPNVLVMHGDPTDNNAMLFGQGYNAVLKPLLRAARHQVGKAAGTWDPPTALSEFQQQFTAHRTSTRRSRRTTRMPLRSSPTCSARASRRSTFPVTGQDATLIGLQNILPGYQCGTVYKPIYLEAQAAAAMAMYLRAGVAPPATLTGNGPPDTTAKSTAARRCCSTPTWVDHVEHELNGHRGQVRAGASSCARPSSRRPARQPDLGVSHELRSSESLRQW